MIVSVMNESPWVEENEAIQKLGVTHQTLKLWRERGYLQPGTHWRSSPEDQPIPWKPKVVYHLRWCKEIIDYWKKEDSPISELAA